MDVELKYGGAASIECKPSSFPERRPKLDARIGLRLPSALLEALTLEADRQRTSLNDLALDMFEHEICRRRDYRLSFYTEYLPITSKLTELR